MSARTAERGLLIFVCCAVVALSSGRAWAGGESLNGRGARALGRAGAFVAGADDGQAFHYNPAGLMGVEGISLMLDAGLIFQRVAYTRTDSGGNVHPTVNGNLEILPIPTLVGTWKPRRTPWMTLALGAWTPYVGINSFPESGPQRYSNINRHGTLLTVLELAAAFRVHPKVWLGVGLQSMYIRYRVRTMTTGCTELTCAPEDPSFDSLNQLDVSSPFTPSGILGLTVLPHPKWRVGLALQLPFWVRAGGTTSSRLPTDPFFANASVVPNPGEGTLAFELPVMIRAGVEWRPMERLRAELALTYEAWSMHKQLTFTPKSVYIDGVPGIGRYYVKKMVIPLYFRDTFALHLGGEYEAIKNRLRILAGYLFETAAAPDEYMTVLTPDGLHNMLTLGLGIRVSWLRIDISYGHLFTGSRNVTNSRAPQINPVQPSRVVAVGNGRYDIDTDILAIGLNGNWN